MQVILKNRQDKKRGFKIKIKKRVGEKRVLARSELYPASKRAM
jgi:hypothetical protein